MANKKLGILLILLIIIIILLLSSSSVYAGSSTISSYLQIGSSNGGLFVLGSKVNSHFYVGYILNGINPTPTNWNKIVSGSSNTDYWKIIDSVPAAPTHLFTELGTGFFLGSWLQSISNASGMPLALIVFPWAFGWSLLFGLLAYVLTMGKAGKDSEGRRPWRGSLPIMAIVSAVCMTYFVIAGGGVIPGWSLIPYIVWAFASMIFRQNQEGRGWA